MGGLTRHPIPPVYPLPSSYLPLIQPLQVDSPFISLGVSRQGKTIMVVERQDATERQSCSDFQLPQAVRTGSADCPFLLTKQKGLVGKMEKEAEEAHPLPSCLTFQPGHLSTNASFPFASPPSCSLTPTHCPSCLFQLDGQRSKGEKVDRRFALKTGKRSEEELCIICCALLLSPCFPNTD